MKVLRTFVGIFAGFLVAMTIISVGVTIDHRWFAHVSNHEINNWTDLYKHWGCILKGTREEFFISLFISCCLGSFFGGIVTALLVPKAKVAYSMLVGLMLLIIAFFELVFIPNHPDWYKFTIWFAFFPFSWMGSKIVEKLIEK
jgi:hypothetical protein